MNDRQMIPVIYIFFLYNIFSTIKYSDRATPDPTLHSKPLTRDNRREYLLK